ncbi:hypothetical protein COCNU_scaffold000525G000040 [Cocos nucifera]|nr:hypothetical protein [Cocos nucifera]
MRVSWTVQLPFRYHGPGRWRRKTKSTSVAMGGDGAEKFRELVGKEAASKSGGLTFLNWLDVGSGSLACGAEEGVKTLLQPPKCSCGERQRATEAALTDALKEGLSVSDAAKQAQKVGAKAAKLASKQAKRILGPIISSGWDFFEAIFFWGTMTERIALALMPGPSGPRRRSGYQRGLGWRGRPWSRSRSG